MATADRSASEAGPAAERPSARLRASAAEAARVFTGAEIQPARKQRRFSRLSVRIMALSIFPVATIFGGLLYVGAYERSLVEAELNALSAQARLFAGAIAESAITPGAPDERRIDVTQASTVMRQL